jgi:hypothetical protein
LVHSQAYLESLRSPAVVARALELWPLRLVPAPLLERGILRPMRLAVAGTMLAMRDGLEGQGIVMNVEGGFHHAFVIAAKASVSTPTSRSRWPSSVPAALRCAGGPSIARLRSTAPSSSA